MQPEELKDQIRRLRRKPLFGEIDIPEVVLDTGAIHRLIPHRDPFLFVGQVRRADLDRGRLTGTRAIRDDDPVFAGHFPGYPVFPGVLQMEMLGQYGLCLLALRRLGTHTVPLDAVAPDIRAVKVHHAAFVREIGPGSTIDVAVELVEENDFTAIVSGQLTDGPEVCSYALMEVYFVE